MLLQLGTAAQYFVSTLRFVEAPSQIAAKSTYRDRWHATSGQACALAHIPHSRLEDRCNDLYQSVFCNNKIGMTASGISTCNAIEVSSVDVGQVKSCNQTKYAAWELPLTTTSRLIQELLPAYFSSRNPTQASILASQQHNMTALGPNASPACASSSSQSTPCQPVASTSASSRHSEPVCVPTSQLGPAAALHRNQFHTSGQVLPCCRPCCNMSSIMLYFGIRV